MCDLPSCACILARGYAAAKSCGTFDTRAADVERLIEDVKDLCPNLPPVDMSSKVHVSQHKWRGCPSA